MRHRADCLNTYCKNMPFSIKWYVYNSLYSIPTLTGEHIHLRITHKRHVFEHMFLHKKWSSLLDLSSLSFCRWGPVTPCIWRQSNENQTPTTKWQWKLFYSQVIARSVNTFIPLGAETINSNLVKRDRSLLDPQTHPLLHFLVWMKQTSMNVFLQVAKNVKSQGERSGLYGGCSSVSQPNLWSLSLTRLAVWGQVLSCKRMILSDSIPGRSDFMCAAVSA